MTIEDIRPPEDIPALHAGRPARAAGSRGAEIWRHRRKDGALIDVEITAAGSFRRAPRRLVLAQDVTERRRLEEQLATPRRWRRSAAWPAAWRTTSTTC